VKSTPKITDLLAIKSVFYQLRTMSDHTLTASIPSYLHTQDSSDNKQEKRKLNEKKAEAPRKGSMTLSTARKTHNTQNIKYLNTSDLSSGLYPRWSN